MRTSLAPSPTQKWRCIGLSRWHQSIARREADRIALLTRDVVIQWTINEPSIGDFQQKLPAFADAAISNNLEPAQVTLVDRRIVEQAIEQARNDAKSSFAASDIFCQRGHSNGIYLVWDWGDKGQSSLEWATALGFAGVIFDFSTLRSWTRVAVERLPTTLKELHPLIASLPQTVPFQRLK
ncbi:hypothetical protein SH449x_005015 [Pirellulaceae bacterium SH449]